MTLHSPGVGGDSATTVATAVWSMLAGTDTDWGRLAAGAGRGGDTTAWGGTLGTLGGVTRRDPGAGRLEDSSRGLAPALGAGGWCAAPAA